MKQLGSHILKPLHEMELLPLSYIYHQESSTQVVIQVRPFYNVSIILTVLSKNQIYRHIENHAQSLLGSMQRIVQLAVQGKVQKGIINQIEKTLTRTESINNLVMLVMERMVKEWEYLLGGICHQFYLHDFKFSKVLGSGRCTVYLENVNGQHIALKVGELQKYEDMLEEMQNEVGIYKQLSDLQGDCIPVLAFQGYLANKWYCIGFSVCGTTTNLNELTNEKQQQLLDALDKIHERGILHNDIKKQNVLLDENGGVFIIDFGFATQDISIEKQESERRELSALLTS
ncbi:hypothetical protein HDV01_003248 [Terramyces sp. JEL0728]|nr:hypothetical protein HDV01_003248 [Terramyces sp. JEL0728]